MTVVDRGSDGEIEDSRLLLTEVARTGKVLPALNKEDLEYVYRAGELSLGTLDRLVLAALVGETAGGLAVIIIKRTEEKERTGGMGRRQNEQIPHVLYK